MWTYEQVNGRLYDWRPLIVGEGYAGRDSGKNAPEAQDQKGIGPLPQGLYTIQPPKDDATVGHYAMRLIPFPENQMFGRSSFFIHGDSMDDPGNASHGCIVMNRIVRTRVWESGDHVLKVVDRLQTEPVA